MSLPYENATSGEKALGVLEDIEYQPTEPDPLHELCVAISTYLEGKK